MCIHRMLWKMDLVKWTKEISFKLVDIPAILADFVSPMQYLIYLRVKTGREARLSWSFFFPQFQSTHPCTTGFSYAILVLSTRSMRATVYNRPRIASVVVFHFPPNFSQHTHVPLVSSMRYYFYLCVLWLQVVASLLINYQMEYSHY